MRPGLFAFAAACAFVGAALYISLVEQPARMALDVRAMLQEWRRSHWRGFVTLATVAVIGAVFGWIDYARSGDVRWLIGATVFVLSWPYAYFLVVPVNLEIYAVPREETGSRSRELMRDWGLLEWGQTAIGLAACWFFAWALAWPT